MENNHRKKLLSMINVLCDPSKQKELVENSAGRVASDGSRQPDPVGEDLDESLIQLSTDYQLTVKIRVQLTRRQISLLLEILNYQSVHFGINFGMYLTMEHLSSLLIGQKESSLHIRDENERRCCSVSMIILNSVGEIPLYVSEPKRLPQVVSQALIENKLIMEKRVYGSRYRLWIPENFIQIVAVPLESQFERIKGNSERYSSYCKGYGESHPSAHRQKTKPSPELDGESEDKDYVRIAQIPSLLILTQLELRAKYLRRSRKS